VLDRPGGGHGAALDQELARQQCSVQGARREQVVTAPKRSRSLTEA
jgi:hypothetical protein